jgi:hypothetical protein
MLEDSIFQPERKLPEPGEILIFENPDHTVHAPNSDRLRVLSWNIERGWESSCLLITNDNPDMPTDYRILFKF